MENDDLSKLPIETPEIWKIIHSYFEGNPNAFVSHHLESYNDFFENGIFQIFKEKNPIRIQSKYDESIKDFRHQCIMYFGGKDGRKIYFGKPVIYDKENPHYMYPNEARLRNMTYAMTIHYDVEVEFIDILEPGQQPYTIGPEYITGGKSQDIDHIPDYSQEIRKDIKTKRKNFKEMEDGEEEQEGGSGSDSDDMEGGTLRQRRRKKAEQTQPYEMTTEMARLLREANQQTLAKDNIQRRTITLEKIYLGKFPIMLQSKFCILNGLSRELRFSMGECRNDPGGYFIIQGKEKTVVVQEKFADNMLYIRPSTDDTYLYSADIRSVSENVSKPIRTFSVKMMAPTISFSYRNIVVNIPNVRKPIPLFILFRALGIISDKAIIEMCLLDLDKYESMVDLFIPSVHDSSAILNQQMALLYIASFTKFNTITYTMEILSDYFLPHIGETNFIEKAYYLGYVVFRLLAVYTGLETATDRDNYKYKRIELVGSLINDLFREYYTIQQREIQLGFEKILYYDHANRFSDNLYKLIYDNYRDVFKERSLEAGIRRAFKGNWGAQPHTKRVGIVQDLNRLSFNSMISHLRKTNLPLDSSVKLVGPRVLHNSHWGFIDPIDTPDGGNIGLHKTLSIITYVSRGYSREPMIAWLRENIDLKPLEECGPILLSTMTRIIVNGLWAGSIHEPIHAVEKFKLFRRNALLPIHSSITFDIKQNTIFIYTDSGRVYRPIFYKDPDTNKWSFELMKKRIEKGEFNWNELISGFNKKRETADFHPNNTSLYRLHELYEGVESETNPAKLERFLKEKAVIDYIDPSETENTLIAMNAMEWTKLPLLHKQFTHMEIHESLMYGVMCNQIIFPENNPVTRNSFSCGQSKQACSLYHTNFPLRMDKTSVVLNNGQIPLVKSRFMEHINHEENPYGENAIVAIMCYTGYNVEDAMLINEGALKRGLFRTTYYTTYEAHEESSKKGDVIIDKRFTNIENEEKVVGTKVSYDYSKLDTYGLIRENSLVDDKTILIGLTSNNTVQPDSRIDISKTPKKGQLGVVDRAFITEGDEGERIAKVRIREERIPNIGDKMASRAGQKGTIGLVVPEIDMPFTSDGIRPDIIINPHAIPSRMTIGQLVECLVGKASVHYGGFSDCTAFSNRGSKIASFGEMLTNAGYHSSGNEILYNGMTGEQIESEIFIGPTYYMRLKHMVKDKINYRALGPRTALTRQPVAGRANDGGLRIGEMERDVLISHGMTDFLKESMMERGDKSYLAVCNTTGMIAIYNPSKNLFLSPSADGPIQFTATLDGKPNALEKVSRFGRDFSVVSIPYSFKLLIQELQMANVQLRIITEDNIKQFENLSFSDNMAKLTFDKTMTPNKLMNQIKQILTKKDGEPQKTPESVVSPELPSPEYMETSPAYEPSSLTPVDYEKLSPAEVELRKDMDELRKQNAGPSEWTVVDREPLPEYVENPNAFKGYFFTPKPVSGGGNKEMYDVGERVHYRGSASMGLSPSHPWQIRNIGHKFITIESAIPLGEPFNTKDSIQVIEANEIYKPELENTMPTNAKEVFSNTYLDNRQMDSALYDTNYNPYGQMPAGGIQVNPVIKIVNGPDNSTTRDDSVGAQPPIQIQNTQPSVVSKINQNADAKQSGGESIKIKESEGGEKSKGLFGNLLDFGQKLLIKKIDS